MPVSDAKLPCASVAVNGYTGPLVGITDDGTGQPFCAGTTLEAKWNFGMPGSAYQVVSDILLDPTVEGIHLHPAVYQNDTPVVGYNPGYNALAGWREWHAEALAIVSRADATSTPSNPIYNSMVTNGYFQCTASPTSSWLRTEYATGAQPSPAPCQTAMPGWMPIRPIVP